MLTVVSFPPSSEFGWWRLQRSLEEKTRIFNFPGGKHKVTILNQLIFYTILSFLMLYANNISNIHFQSDYDSSSGYVQSTPHN